MIFHIYHKNDLKIGYIYVQMIYKIFVHLDKQKLTKGLIELDHVIS